MLNPILLVFSLFVIRHFFLLAKKHNQYLFLYSFFGVLYFLISCYLLSLISTIIFLVAFDNLASYDIVMSCFTIPLALIISGIYYKFLEMKFKKKRNHTKIKQIGIN